MGYKSVYDSDHTRYLNGYCRLLPYGYLICENHFICDACEVGDRIRIQVSDDHILFDHRDALPQTPTGCQNFCNMPLILSPSAMERLRIKSTLINQIMIANPSPGCFQKNPVGEIDGYLFNRPSYQFTVTRNEVFGVPNSRCVERYDQIFRLRLCRFFEKR